MTGHRVEEREEGYTGVTVRIKHSLPSQAAAVIATVTATVTALRVCQLKRVP